MSDKIHLLPDTVANQIAAGEVVNRPASVVKEMMENAVDAGSSNITVNYRGGGKELIKVIDDGDGMSPADARLAFDKHATSKITSLDDVYALHTFGFRGEALASIAAIAHVELLTRREEDELGIKIVMEGSRLVEQCPEVAPKGSQFSVKNLFFNIPARRRALDKSTTEPRYIAEEFRRVALCHPEVGMALYGEDAPIYNLPASNLKQRIVGVIGKGIATKLLEIDTDTTVVKIRGFVGHPSSAKQSGREQYMFVNGRFFKSPYFHKAILQAYEKLVPAGMQPSYFVYLEIDPEKIDVNIHPQKTEVSFDDGAVIWQILHAAAREALAKMGAVSLMDFETGQSVDIPVRRKDNVAYNIPSSTTNPAYNPFDEGKGRKGTAGVSDFSVKSPLGSLNAIGRDEAIDGFEKSMMEFIEYGVEEQPIIGEEFDNVFQQRQIVRLVGGYVAYSDKGELVVADLRRAKEVILYERYLMMLGNETSVSQKLLFPEFMTLSGDDVSLLRERADDFLTFGFEYNVVNDNEIEITGIPADFSMDDIQELLYNMIDGMRENAEVHQSLRNEHLAAIMARDGSKRLPKNLTSGEIEAIIDSIMMGGRYNFTPDGRSVVVRVRHDEIKRLFRAS